MENNEKWKILENGKYWKMESKEKKNKENLALALALALALEKKCKEK